MVSSGMRLGAWDYLKWKDISSIVRDDKVIAAKIKIYSEEEDEHFSFITPEAFHFYTLYELLHTETAKKNREEISEDQ